LELLGLRAALVVTYRREGSSVQSLASEHDASHEVALIRVLLSGILAAEATAILALPWAGPSGLLITFVMLLPVALIASVSVFAGHQLGKRWQFPSSWPAYIVIGMVSVGLLMAGMYASNVLLVDTALQKRTLIGYGV